MIYQCSMYKWEIWATFLRIFTKTNAIIKTMNEQHKQCKKFTNALFLVEKVWELKI